ncbi:MAG: acyltransferase [Lachnospiraceae bacterium]|nr:acyltransferase [Lachnospiraceae bacterium]
MNMNKIEPANRIGTTNRIGWVDTLKCIGMFSIYVGHFLSLTGLSYAFIFAYGVQVFFFVSGFFAISGKKRSLKETLLHRIRTLLVPYVCFSILALVIISLQNNYGLEQVLPLVKQSLLGMRNQTPAIALWFLPALFIMQVLYDLLYRALRQNRLLIFLLSMVLFILTAVYIDPIGQPKWIFSLDSALYFFPFYAMGPLLYPVLCFDWKELSMRRKGLFAVLGAAILAVTMAIYFAKMLPFYQLCKNIPLFPVLYPFFTACVLIGFLYILARALEHLPLLQAMGQKTLYFCGSETILKILVPEFLSICGLTFALNDPLSVYLYGAVLMLLGYYILIPIEKKLFGRWF